MTLVLVLAGTGVIAGLVTIALVTLDARRFNRHDDREAYVRPVSPEDGA